jgi:glycosyltransferase involved in cell wall biosynthesis
MRVVIGYEIFSAQRAGGISRYFTSLHDELVEMGIDAHLVAGVHDNCIVRSQPKVYGFRLRRAPRLLYRSVDRFLAPMFEEALVGGHRPSIYHRTYFHRPPPRRSSAVAITLHDTIMLRHAEFADVAPAMRRAFKAGCDAADVIFTPSSYTRDCIVDELGVGDERIVITPHGVKPPAIEDRAEAPRNSILFIGQRSVRYKNFSVFVEGVAQSKVGASCPLVLFGGGSLIPGESELLDRRGLLGRTVVSGGDDAALWRALRNAALLVVPSVEEGFGLPVLEGIAAECPVVCSTGGALPEVGGNAAVFFDPADPGQLAEAIDRVLDDSQVRARLVAAGRQRAEQFTWRKTAELTLGGYLRSRAQ